MLDPLSAIKTMLLQLVVVLALTSAAASPGFLPARTAATRWTAETVLCYLDARSEAGNPNFVWDSARFERLLAFHDAPADRGGGAPVDTLFNTFLLLGYEWRNGTMFWPGQGKAPGMNKTDWLGFLDLQLSMGAANLELAAANVSARLPGMGGGGGGGGGGGAAAAASASSCGGVRPSVILAVPCPDPRQTAFGPVAPGAPSLNFSTLADRVAAVQWWVREAVARWAALVAAGSLQRTSLLGFYWFHESIDPGDEQLLPALASTIHGLDPSFLFTWIPYFRSVDDPEYAAWRDYGFDYVTLQPNFAFHNTSAGQRFADVAQVMKENHLGVELELPDYIRNPQVASWQESFTTYLDHVSAWPQSPMKTYLAHPAARPPHPFTHHLPHHIRTLLAARSQVLLWQRVCEHIRR